MRAYLIDPEVQAVTEIDFLGDYKKIQQVIGCDSFTTGIVCVCDDVPAEPGELGRELPQARADLEH